MRRYVACYDQDSDAWFVDDKFMNHQVVDMFLDQEEAERWADFHERNRYNDASSIKEFW